MEEEIMETVLHDMLQDLQIIKQQQQYLVKFQEDLETQYQLMLRIEQKLSGFSALPVTLTDDQVSSLKDVMRQEFELLQTELQKQPVTHKAYYSVFPVSFRMEYFRMVVNTVMTWIVILIVLFFVIWLVVRHVS